MIIERARQLAQRSPARVVFPDALDVRVLKAANYLHQHGLAGPQTGQGRRPPGQIHQIALGAGHEDGERGQGHGRRRQARGHMHHLRIADHQIRRLPQGGKGLRQLLFRHHKAQAAAVQAVPDGLHLRHARFRCRL